MFSVEREQENMQIPRTGTPHPSTYLSLLGYLQLYCMQITWCKSQNAQCIQTPTQLIVTDTTVYLYFILY